MIFSLEIPAGSSSLKEIDVIRGKSPVTSKRRCERISQLRKDEILGLKPRLLSFPVKFSSKRGLCLIFSEIFPTSWATVIPESASISVIAQLKRKRGLSDVSLLLSSCSSPLIRWVIAGGGLAVVLTSISRSLNWKSRLVD